MKILKIIMRCVLGLVLITCLALIVLPHVSSFQYYIGSTISRLLSEKLNTEVSVGRVYLGLPDNVVIDDVLVYDQQHKKMLQSDRLTADVEIWSLIKDKKVRINSIGLYSMTVDIYKMAADGTEPQKYNFQFVADAFASEDTTHTPLDLKIKDVTIRRGNIHYADLQNKILLEDLNTKIALNSLTDDNLSVRICKLETILQQAHQPTKTHPIDRLRVNLAQGKLITPTAIKRLDIENLSANIDVSFAKKKYGVSAFNLRLDQSDINIDTIGYDVISKQFMAEVKKSIVSLRDFYSVLPALKNIDKKVILTANVKGDDDELVIDTLDLLATDNSIRIAANGNLSRFKNADANIGNFAVKSEVVASLSKIVELPEVVRRLGDIGYSGNLKTSDKMFAAKGKLTSSLGDVVVDGTLIGKNAKGVLKTDGLDLAKLLANNSLGKIAGDIRISKNEVKGKISRFDYQGYTFNNIGIDVKGNTTSLSALTSDIELQAIVDDANGKITANGTWSKAEGLSAEIDAENVNLHGMHLIKSYPNTTFSTRLTADMNEVNIDKFIGQINAEDFVMTSPTTELHVDKIDLVADTIGGERRVAFTSDLVEVGLQGDFCFADVPADFTHAIQLRIPSMPGLPKIDYRNKHKYSLDVKLLNPEALSQIVQLPIKIAGQTTIHGNIDGYADKMNINMMLPSFEYKGEAYHDCVMNLDTPNDTMLCSMHLKKPISSSQQYDFNIDVAALNDRLSTVVSWNNPKSGKFNGRINAGTTFFLDDNKKSALRVNIQPSELVFNDTVWSVAPAKVEYAGNKLVAEDLEIRHGDQFLNIDGTASNSSDDSLVVSLHDMNIEYILDAVDFHSVDFCGLASGKATIKAAFGIPIAYADLNCRKFQFEYGDLGTIAIKAEWNREEKQIDINAYSSDEADGHVSVNGYISPSKDYIDLKLVPDNTNMAFLQYFVDNVMDSTVGRCSGNLQLVGPLSSIQLIGAVSANAKFHVHVLGTDYEVRGDTVYFVPDDILFKNVKAYDKYNNSVVVNGGLHHKSLTRMTFDIDFDTDKILAYDFDDFYGESFYGTVFAKGNVQMHGISGSVEINADVTPLKGSTFTYNAVVQNYLNTQKFITFRDKKWINENGSAGSPQAQEDDSEDRIRSNLYCNFTLNVDENSQIRVLMDTRSNDYITLYGNGTIKANYYNKGKFGLYGTYNVSRGDYSLTLQNILKKNFQFQNGGSIVFGGDPYDAIINLQALYTVNNVSLSDLALGTNFTDNTIRVNCLMNITGQPKQPKVNFDLDLPTVNSDEKQMIRSIINSEEDMNQQVVYLLGIGRFYTRGVNNADQNASRSQTTLAMQSLLSGTISSQLNTMLSQVLKTNNWNFGANISTGTEGWENAQYEGMVSGRMFNNRLLFNGQFGYRDNINTAQTNFIGDFDLQYMLTQSGNLSVKAYNQTNERYFTKSALNTQGLGLLIKKEFSSFGELFGKKRKRKTDK